MSKYEIPFLTACIRTFARRFAMTRQAAFRYLQEHKGLAFLIEFYDVENPWTKQLTTCSSSVKRMEGRSHDTLPWHQRRH